MSTQHHPKGFTLLISLILTSVILALGISLLDIAYKQILLSSSAKQSQYAFYNADSALECALYYDQKRGVFGYDFPGASTDVMCNNTNITNYTTSRNDGVRTTVFSVPCPSGGVSASVTILKQTTGSTNIYANGFNTCDAASRTRIERGLKVRY